MPPAPLVVGVTAHRNIPATETAGIELRLREFFRTLRVEFADVPVHALCSLAEGGERLFAREAVQAGVPLIIALPFSRRLYDDDFSGEASRAEFRSLCAHGHVLELPLRPGIEEADVVGAGAARDLQYAQQGVFISQHSQILVAIWDGKDSDQLGGTAQVVRYHHEDEMPGFTDGILDAQQLLTGNENDLVYHIVCSRDTPDGAPAAPLEPLQAFWLTADAVLPGAAGVPQHYRQIWRRTAEFNRDAARHAGRVDSAGLNSSPFPSLDTIDRTFRVTDRLANHYQRRVTITLRSVYSLAVLMGLAFIVYSDLVAERVAIVAFLTFFGAGLLLVRIARDRAWHRKYLDYRALAEGLRVQFYWRLSAVTDPDRTGFAHDNFLQKQDVELGWIRNVMRATSLRTELEPAPEVKTGLEIAMHDWIGDETRGQLGYYTRKADERTLAHVRTERMGHICLWAGIGMASLLAVLSARIDANAQSALVLLMGVLPLAAGVRSAYAKQKADKELIKQYRFMQRIFQNARRRLDAARTAAEKREILRALGDAALDEHAEWILMHRERPLEHGQL